MLPLIKPKDIQITTMDGDVKTYTLSRMDAYTGREVAFKYMAALIPKVGDYSVSEEMSLKMMGFVAVDAGGQQLRLSTRALANNHIPDTITLMKVEWGMIEHNAGFFGQEKSFVFFQKLKAMFRQLVSQTMTPSSPP